MTDETVQQKIERLETEVKNLRLGMGALIVCLVRVGVEGRFPFSDDSQVLGLPIAMGRAGIPPQQPRFYAVIARKRRWQNRMHSLKRSTQARSTPRSFRWRSSAAGNIRYYMPGSGDKSYAVPENR